MRSLFTGKKIKIDQNSVQDIIFLVSIFLFFTVLTIGLFPGNEIGIVVGKNFFILTLMTVPVVAAIYFISISFRRRIYKEPFNIGSSIKNKMAMAFIFVAIVPTLIIVLASNNFINKTLSRLLSDKTFNALKESVSLSQLNMDRFVSTFEKEMYTLSYLIEKNIVNHETAEGRNRIREKFKFKGISVLFFRVQSGPNANRLFPIDVNDKKIRSFFTFLTYSDLSSNIRLDKIFDGKRQYLLGSLRKSNSLIVLYMPVPAVYERMKRLFTNSLEEYGKHRYLKAFFKSSSGIFLLILTIVIVALSILVSFFLSRSITRPVLELTESTKELANGNFNIRLTRKSDDELSILYRAFNFMVKELENNRKLVFQKQKLEAWREMATRLVHEIKNPLTPIRLSA